jgi:hypothetical protein
MERWTPPVCWCGAPVAQWIEHLTTDQKVGGSTPSRRAGQRPFPPTKRRKKGLHANEVLTMDDQNPEPETAAIDLPSLGLSPSGKVLDTLAALSTLVPLVGGAVGQVLSGVATAPRLERVEQVLQYVVDRLDGEPPPLNPSLDTDEFRDLLEQTIGQAAFESHVEKRALYGKLLLGLIKEPLEPYDPRRRYISTLEEIQPGQIPLLKEIAIRGETPTTDMTEVRGLQDLATKMAAENAERAAFIDPNRDAIQHLVDMGLVVFPTSTPRLPKPALRTKEAPKYPQLTDYGWSFVGFLASD